MKKSLFILCLGLLLHTPYAIAGGCNSACYAQKQAAKARVIAARRQQARIAHNRAIAAQKARRAAAAKKQAQLAQARAQARRHAQQNKHPQHRAQQTARRAVQARPQARRSYQRMSPQQYAAAMALLRARANVYNTVSGAYQNTMNSMAWRSSVLNAQRVCGIAGNCRVETRRIYR